MEAVAMKKTILITLLAMTALGTMLVGQNQTAPPVKHEMMTEHHLQFLTTVLSLTPAQQAQANTIFTNAANSNSQIRENMRTAHQALHTAIKNNDTAGIDQASTQAICWRR
jgi:Spy/CpxP family protein refolding chaperone